MFLLTPVIKVNPCQSAEKKKGNPDLFPIALFQNLILIDTRNKCDAGFFEVYLSGGVYEAYGEDFSFEPLRLSVHSVGRVHHHDSGFGSALSHTRSSFMTSYASEAYNRKTLQVWFFVRISCQFPL